MLDSGKLRHRAIIQYPVETQDQNTGEPLITWTDLATVWCEIAPLSVSQFIAADAEQSKVTTRITIRYRDDITPKMRLYHSPKAQVYDIQGIMVDKESGLEYQSLACSEGVRYV